jgi:hydroxymethylbilane synthase
MGGSCSMPLAAHAVWDGAQLRLNAAWGEPEEDKASTAKETSDLVVANISHPVADIAAATAMGEEVAAKLLANGARKYTK